MAKANVLVGILLAAAVLAAPAAASVRLLGVTSPASPGSSATLSIAVSPAATCSITVQYKSGPSHAAGLYPQRGSKISWTWKVGTNTTPGRWPIYVRCGAAGSVSTSFVVG